MVVVVVILLGNSSSSTTLSSSPIQTSIRRLLFANPLSHMSILITGHNMVGISSFSFSSVAEAGAAVVSEPSAAAAAGALRVDWPPTMPPPPRTSLLRVAMAPWQGRTRAVAAAAAAAVVVALSWTWPAPRASSASQRSSARPSRLCGSACSTRCVLCVRVCVGGTMGRLAL